MKQPPQHAIILFDGICNLCNAGVNFVIDHDPAGYFRFAAQQSPAGQALLAEHGLATDQPHSIVLIEAGRASTRSHAALRVALHLHGWVKLLAVGIAIPAFVRDEIYNFIATHRYRWFGRMQACRMPSEAIRDRFL